MIYREPNYEAEQAITNRINAKTRHCRIGKVRIKTGIDWADRGIPPFKYQLPYKWEPVAPPLTPWWMQGPWCNQADIEKPPVIPAHGVLI